MVKSSSSSRNTQASPPTAADAMNTNNQLRPSRSSSTSSSNNAPGDDGSRSISGVGTPSIQRSNSGSGRRASLLGSTRRKNSNTSIGNAINQALGNSPQSGDDLGLLSSEEEEDEIGRDDNDAPYRRRSRARTNSNAARSSAESANDLDNEDDYHEESFSGPLHYVRVVSQDVPIS